MYEVRALMEYAYFAKKDSWEQSRMIGYITAQVQSKRKIKPQDLMEFPWEKEQDAENQGITTEQVDALRSGAKFFEEQMNSTQNIQDKQ